jgi:hypothetical protein
MERLFSWEVCAVVVPVLLAFASLFLTLNDFRLAKLFFLLAAADAIGGIAMEGAKSSRPLWQISLLVIACGDAVAFLTMLLFRYTDKKAAAVNPAASLNPELAQKILEKLDQIQRQQVKPETSFVISYGPILNGVRPRASMFFIGPRLTPSPGVSGPIWMDHVDLVFYAGILNVQAAPTLIQGYVAEIKKTTGNWIKLETLDTISQHIYMRNSQKMFFPLDKNDFLDRSIYHKPVKSGSAALGWALFRYPDDLGDLKSGEWQLRLTVFGADGKTTTTEYQPAQAEGGVQGAAMNYGPALQMPASLEIKVR